jgi:pSer/pThr/pTyr-binding forkhead associated (FHA) protein
MSALPIDAGGVSPLELQERIRADRLGEPYLLYRDAEGTQRIESLGGGQGRLTIGRAAGCEVPLEWDAGVSRAHAQLELLVEDDWALVDDGLSRNGTFVNGERVQGRRRLTDGDLVRCGDTLLSYQAPARPASSTALAVDSRGEITLSAAQRRVLVALCRPVAAREYGVPASNDQIAAELVLSVSAVKTHLRSLFDAFHVEELPRSAKRARLAQLAFETGVIAKRDLES